MFPTDSRPATVTKHLIGFNVTIYKKVEMAANVAIIAVAALLGTVIVRNYLISPRTQQTTAGESGPNSESLSTIGVDWKQSRQTLVLALSTGCHYCTDSAPFYRQLASIPRSTRLIALLPQPVAESRDYLKSLGVTVDDVKQVQFSSIKIGGGTPTLLLINENGLVTKSWIGKLAEDQQKEVLKEIS
jgi:hypothetical protein